MRTIGVGLIGTGFMGKCHTLAYRSVRAVFDTPLSPRLVRVGSRQSAAAERHAARCGFESATDDWRVVVDDPDVDIISITTPNKLHCEMALAALEAGKHVYCEKPLALTLEEAERMAAAATKARGKTIVGYGYLCNPLFQHARALIRSGAIGRPLFFRGVCDEDYQADPDLPWTWRSAKAAAGLGVLGDMMCHLVSMADGLLGPIESVLADCRIHYATRRAADGGERLAVENEDVASALVTFESGVTGMLSSSRAAWGRKNHLAWELHGDAGMLVQDQERMNELQLYRNDGPKSDQGFKTILAGPAHEPYGNFCPAPGHGLGFKRPQGHRAGQLPEGDRGGRAGLSRFRRRPAVRTRHPCHRAVGGNGGQGPGRRCLLQEVVASMRPRQSSLGIFSQGSEAAQFKALQ